MNAYIDSVIKTVERRDNAKPEYIQAVKETFGSLEKVIEAHPEYDDDDLTPKQRKKKEKQEKELAKAKKKYGYMFKDDKNTSSIKDDAEQEETTASASEQLLNKENKGLQSEIKKEDVSIDEKTLETMTDEEKRMLAQILEKLKEK